MPVVMPALICIVRFMMIERVNVCGLLRTVDVWRVYRMLVLMMTVMALHNYLRNSAALVRANQHLDVLTHAACQRAQRIPAFQRRNDAAVRIKIRDRDQLLRHPTIVSFHPTERGEFVITMRVKASRNHDKLRLEFVQRG